LIILIFLTRRFLFSPFRSRISYCYVNGSVHVLSSVQSCDSCLAGLIIRHLNETIALGAMSFTIEDDSGC